MLNKLREYKKKVMSVLYNSTAIKEFILGESYDETTADDLLAKHIKAYLDVDESTLAADTYICVENTISKSNAATMNMIITIWVFCHKDILNCHNDGPAGTRPDILSDLIETSLLTKDNVNKFGIGTLRLDSVGLMEPQKKYYGRILQFSFPDFR